MIYLFLLLLLLFGALKYEFSSTNRGINRASHNRYLFFIWILFVVVAGFAYNLGRDTKVYVDFFINWVPLPELRARHFDSDYSRYQPGFVVIFSFFRWLSPNYLWYQLAHAVFIYWVLFHFAKKYSQNPIFVLLLFFLVNFLEFSFEIQRESIAVCFALLSYESFDNKKYIRAGLWAILAFSCHVSAVALLIILLLSVIKQTRFGAWVFLVLCVLSTVILYHFPYFDLVLSMFDTEEALFESIYALNEAGNLNIAGIIMQFLKYLIVPFLAIVLNKNAPPRFLYLALFFASLRITSYFSYGLYRISNYFSVFYFILAADAVQLIIKNLLDNRTSGGIIKFFVVITFVVYFLAVFDLRLLQFEIAENAFFYERYFPYSSVFGYGNSYY